MDTRLTADQIALFDTIRRLTADLGPGAVGDLDDASRRVRLDDAVAATGVRSLRDADDDGSPLASGVEAAIVAEALGTAPADAAYLGPTLAADLCRRAGIATDDQRRTVLLTRDLSGLAVASGAALDEQAVAIDAEGSARAVLLAGDGEQRRLVEIELDAPVVGADLTRRQVETSPGVRVREMNSALLSFDEIAAWTALGLSIAAADAVGAMRGAVTLAVGYAAERRQYGVPVGSFQAVQHLLADAHTLTEGALSITRYAAWAVDALEPAEALRAARMASSYVGRAQREVGETVIQVHGGIGNTWECMAHVFLRRTLHDDAILGNAESLLTALADEMVGAA